MLLKKMATQNVAVGENANLSAPNHFFVVEIFVAPIIFIFFFEIVVLVCVTTKPKLVVA